MLTRTERTWEIRNTINKQWSISYFKFIQDNPDKPWKWYYISNNSNITFKIIKENN
jgi:hypothetical protein